MFKAVAFAMNPLDKVAADFRYFREDQLDVFKFVGNDSRHEFGLTEVDSA